MPQCCICSYNWCWTEINMVLRVLSNRQPPYARRQRKESLAICSRICRTNFQRSLLSKYWEQFLKDVPEGLKLQIMWNDGNYNLRSYSLQLTVVKMSELRRSRIWDPILYLSRAFKLQTYNCLLLLFQFNSPFQLHRHARLVMANSCLWHISSLSQVPYLTCWVHRWTFVCICCLLSSQRRNVISRYGPKILWEKKDLSSWSRQSRINARLYWRWLLKSQVPF